MEFLAGLDVRVSVDTAGEFADFFEHRQQHPAHVELVIHQIEVLVRIGSEVEHNRHLRRHDGLVDALCVAQNTFDVAPFHRHELTVGTEEQDTGPTGFRTPTAQQGRGVDAVERPVGGYLVGGPSQRGKGFVPVVAGQRRGK